MSDWSFDITAAPRGEWLHGTETRKGKDGKETIVETSEYQHEWVWLWSKCGKKVRTRWLPPTRFNTEGRWDGFAPGEVPIAWHPYIVPADPVMSLSEEGWVEQIAVIAEGWLSPDDAA